MRVLGLDQSTNITGYAIVENGVIISSGTFKATARHGATQRMEEVRAWLDKTIRREKIDFVVLEDTTLEANPKIFKMLSCLLGILENTCHNACRREILSDYTIVSPKVWRARFAIKGRTRAEVKANIMEYTKQISTGFTEDEAEAALIALYGHYLFDGAKTERGNKI